MPDLYYIDGYNVLHAHPDLRSLANADLESAREALTDEVAAFCAATGKRAVLVFDGTGPHQPERAGDNRGAAGLEVIYAPARLSADAVIERRIYREAHRMEAIVITDDHGVRDLCRGMGALVMNARNFIATLREAEQDTRRIIHPPPKELDGARVEEHLGTDALDQLQALKKRLTREKE